MPEPAEAAGDPGAKTACLRAAIASEGIALDYILLYRGDREALSSSLDRIQRAASVILKAVSVGG